MLGGECEFKLLLTPNLIVLSEKLWSNRVEEIEAFIMVEVHVLIKSAVHIREVGRNMKFGTDINDSLLGSHCFKECLAIVMGINIPKSGVAIIVAVIVVEVNKTIRAVNNVETITEVLSIMVKDTLELKFRDLKVL